MKLLETLNWILIVKIFVTLILVGYPLELFIGRYEWRRYDKFYYIVMPIYRVVRFFAFVFVLLFIISLLYQFYNAW